eukprot:12222388-Alexandrium_andersonii.AAC.1
MCIRDRSNTPAETEKGPAFHRDGAAVPAGSTGRDVLVQGLQSTKVGDPEVSAPRAATEGVAGF